MAECKLCGKEVDKNTAFKLSTRTYCCSEEELNRHNELANLVKIGRETLYRDWKQIGRASCRERVSSPV